MSKFRVTWPTNKVTEIEVDEALHPDAYALSRWGVDSAAAVFEQFGVKLEVVSDDEPLLNGNTVAAKVDALNQVRAEVAAKAQSVAAAKALIAAQD